MKLDISTGDVFTDAGEYVKTLRCPARVDESQIRVEGESLRCEVCARTLLDTSRISDATLLSLVREAPDTCLSIRPDQPNLSFLHPGLSRPVEPTRP